jgi:hypothetical protein
MKKILKKLRKSYVKVTEEVMYKLMRKLRISYCVNYVKANEEIT